MLSILIPVYRFDVRPLVRALFEQASRLREGWEIICMDDGSPEAWQEKNREIRDIGDRVHYSELSKNVGRAKIRNLLAQEARYPWLLFMDCDGMPAGPGFLRDYLAACQPGRVVVGARTYASAPPADTERFFHWYYGKKREERPAAERNLHPYDAFCTFHFLCPREVFMAILLDESLRKYGHEDTLFGFELRKRGIVILHIDNAMVHLDVETTDVFLQKTRQGIENLATLGRKNPALGSRLLRTYWKIRPFSKVFVWGFRLFKKGMERHFHGKRPNLLLFDLYKLGWLSFFMGIHKKRPPG
ncbi:MAG: glycosyltransferase family 2 protein [Saprospirales bacterium]|nr:glycosyltransferase family 2 protein [Saprospirales bacterium]